jgi:hypothetical protein
VAAGIAVGSSGAVILISGLFIGMLLLSIIPIYTPDNSVEGYGESKENFLYKIKQISLFLSFSISYSRINDQSYIYKSYGSKFYRWIYSESSRLINDCRLFDYTCLLFLRCIFSVRRFFVQKIYKMFMHA